MCPLKNLLAKRSTKDLRNPALSPYPPNNFPFKPLIEGETNHEPLSEWGWDLLGPQSKPKREHKQGSKSKRESKRPKPYYHISQEVYTAHEYLGGKPKKYWITQLLWKEQEQTWFYLLKEGVRPDGPLAGWVAETVMRAPEMEGMVLC